MAVKYGVKKKKQTYLFSSFIAAVLLLSILGTVVNYFYVRADKEAFETLHIQTKQIKDNMQLQLHSDFENLETMANFASKLYNDGEEYHLMFESFKPIGLIDYIGILTPDNYFITQSGKVDLSGRISFDEEKNKGRHISDRTESVTTPGVEVVRCAVPIKSGETTVSILYGVIKLETLDSKYRTMAEELNAQLFVFAKANGSLVIETINSKLENISILKDRVYKDGYSYEEMIANDKGYTSFVSAYTGEQLYVHYAVIDEFDWKLLLARPESQVFEEAHAITKVLLTSFISIVFILLLYMYFIFKGEKRRNRVMNYASNIRRLLLEINQQNSNITESLKNICELSKSRSAMFTDTDGEDYIYVRPDHEGAFISDDDKTYFLTEIFRYANDYHKFNHSMLGVMTIIPNSHLVKTNQKFYEFLKKNLVSEVTFVSVTDKNNHVSILGVINPGRSKSVRMLLEEIAFCFSIAIFNKKHLTKTEFAATTDSLTAVSNRVAYKNDVLIFDKEKPKNFACVYVDVNELHMCNNKYGHAAGDAMLLFIANTLKEVFYGQHIYRMGGDEFLIFTENIGYDEINKALASMEEQLSEKNYHVAVGVSYRSQNTNTEEMVREAEIKMYDEKSKYYQNKEKMASESKSVNEYKLTKTGIREIDTLLSVLKEQYYGIYRVSLKTDCVHRILMPSYLSYNEDENNYSALFSKYINDMVSSDYQRTVSSFLNYDSLGEQIMKGDIPQVTFNKINGQTVVLRVYNLDGTTFNGDTLWVFSKK